MSTKPKSWSQGQNITKSYTVIQSTLVMWVLPKLDVRHFTSYYCIKLQGKCMIQTQEYCEKPHFGPDSGSFGPNLGCPIFFFFFKHLASSVTRYHGQVSSCKISEKLMIRS